MLADGQLYVTNEDGLTSVLKAGPTFELLAENALERLHAQLVGGLLAGGLFLRTGTTGALWAIGECATGARSRYAARPSGHGFGVGPSVGFTT